MAEEKKVYRLERCPFCGASIREDTAVCDHCRAPVRPRDRDGHLDDRIERSLREAKQRAGYADLKHRMGALAIDSLVLAVVAFIPVLALTLGLRNTGAGIELLSVTLAVIVWLYYAVMESSPKQATIGKMAMHLAVSDTSGGRISFMRATARFWAKAVSSFFYIGYLMIPFTKKKQSLHDKVSGCVVMKREQTA